MPLEDKTMPAVVLGGAVNALSVARSLWRSGVPVDLLADGRTTSIARHSRACRRYLAPSDGEAVAEEWMTWLLNESAPAVLPPCGGAGVEFLSRRRDELEAAGHLPIEVHDQASLDMLDKARAYELARSAEIPAPQTITISTLAELEDLDFTFPCGIKALPAPLLARHFETASKVLALATAEQARRVLSPILQAGHPMLLTEVIPGPH